MLEVTDLSFSYEKGEKILSDFCMSLCKGEIVALVGPSGCGKSTLLRLIAGLLQPSDGAIDWKESGIPELGFVFQKPALMPWATVAQNVSLPSELKSKGLSDADALDLLEAVGLAGLSHRFPQALSGGQQMRVSIARALSLKPELLLLDEPFAALDEILRFRMNELMLKLRSEQGWGAIFVTHSIYEAVYLSDRVVVMDCGKIKAEINHHLDRSLSPNVQRTSAAYLEAVQAVASALEEGAVNA